MSRKSTGFWPTPTQRDWKSGKSLKDYGNARPLSEAVLDDAPDASPQLTLFAEGSLASQSAPQESERATRMTGGSGQSSSESFAKLGPDGSWLRTCRGYSQLTMDGSSETYSETWPRAGTMQNGIAYRQQPLVPRISGTGSSLWPTPKARDYRSGLQEANWNDLNVQVCREQNISGSGGTLNPTWVELLMGFPAGWTDLEAGPRDGRMECQE